MIFVSPLLLWASWPRASASVSAAPASCVAHDVCEATIGPSLVQRLELNERTRLMDLPGPITCSVPRCERSNFERCNESLCCSTQMYEGLSQITDWLDARAIRYVVLAGTLLGAHRDQDIIPWTSDLDIGIFQNDSEKVFEQRAIPFRFGYDPWFSMPRGCEARVTESDKKIGVEYISVVPTRSELASGSSLSKKGGYDIDLYLIDDNTRGGSVHEKCLASSGGAYREGLRTTLVTIRGKQFRAPANVGEYIECKYGKNWRIPDPRHDWGALLELAKPKLSESEKHTVARLL